MATVISVLGPEVTQGLLSLSLTLTVYLLSLAVYRLLFSTLAKVPGPKLWALSRLPYLVSLLRGKLAFDIQKFHDKYGDAVRVAPNEVSFAAPDAWHDVYASRSGRPPFAKNPLWYKPPPGQVPSMITTSNYMDHNRMNGLLKRAFTEKALQDQEYIIQSYVNLLVSSLREKTSSGTSINMVDWFNYVTFDIIGDLGFGEPFDCLKNTAYHPWVSMVFYARRMFGFAAATRFYPLVGYVVRNWLRSEVMKNALDHHQLSIDKVHRRLSIEKERHDFMTPVMELNEDMQRMSLPEIESTFSHLIVGGSETTSTTLSGITNYLIQTSPAMHNLITEIRGTFEKEEDITMDSVRSLPYLGAVISEGLRLCNPFPAGLARLVPTEGDTVCGQRLPGNTHVKVHPYTMYNSPKLFHRPESFVPERWLPSPSCPAEYAADQLSAVHPFSLGPRRCLGQALAMIEMRLILARLVWAFDMEAVPGSLLDWRTLKLFNNVQMQPVMVTLKARVGQD